MASTFAGLYVYFLVSGSIIGCLRPRLVPFVVLDQMCAIFRDSLLRKYASPHQENQLSHPELSLAPAECFYGLWFPRTYLGFPTVWNWFRWVCLTRENCARSVFLRIETFILKRFLCFDQCMQSRSGVWACELDLRGLIL